MDFSDAAVAGIGGAVTGWAGNQIKENDAAKVQAETERREKLLIEKEKRQDQVEEYRALRNRGWQVEDSDKKRTQELEDADTKYVNAAALHAGDRAFQGAQTDKQIASHLEVARMNNATREDIAAKKPAAQKGALTEYQREKLGEKKGLIIDSGVNDGNINQLNAINDALGEPRWKKVITQEKQDNTIGFKGFGIGGKEEKSEYVEDTSGVGSIGEESQGMSPAAQIAKNVSFKKGGANTEANPGEQTGTVIQPKPLNIKKGATP